MEQACKMLNFTDGSGSTMYIDTRCLPLTFNICERLSLIAKQVLSNQRRGALPTDFEKQMLLYMNSMCWSVEDVKDVVHGSQTVF